MMASKIEIDNFFNNNYDVILKETRHWVAYCSNATTDAEDYLADSYQYLLKNKDKVGNTERDIKNYTMRFIIDSVKWYNSSTNKTNRRINNGEYILMDEITPNEDIEDDEYSLLDNEEYLYKVAAIELYNQRASKEDRIVYQVYANKEKRTVRALGAHLNIKNTQSWHKICEMKSGIKEIYEGLKNNHNK